MPRRSTRLSLFASAVAVFAHLFAAPAHAMNLPQPVTDGAYGLQRVGGGDLSWLGRPIYNASLWAPEGRFAGYAAGNPVALCLWYQRAFTRDELVRITATAWRLLGDVPREQRERWSVSLRGIWSDVQPGDNITAVVLPGRETRFYDADGFRGEVADPAFGPAFMSIWLDSRSVVGDLRVRLLGAEPSVAQR